MKHDFTDEYQYHYEVTVSIPSVTEPGAFASLDCVSEFEYGDNNGMEVYTVHSDIDLEAVLDGQPGVVSYKSAS